MHILLVSTYGFDTQFPSRPEFMLAQTLAEQGHTVSAIEYWHNRNTPQIEHYMPGFTIYRCRTVGFFSKDLITFARTIPTPDIVNIHHLRNLLAYQAVWLWHKTVPIILSPYGILHDGDLVDDRERPLETPIHPERIFRTAKQLLQALMRGKHPRRAVRNYLLHAPLSKFAGFIAISHHEKLVLTELGFAADQIRVVSCPVDFQYYQPHPNPQKPERPTVIFIGQLILRKGWDVLLQAAPLMRAQIPNIRIILITHNTSQLAQLHEFIAHNQLQDTIEIHLRVPEAVKVDLLLQSHVLVSPSRYEGFGIPVIEGMAAHCAVVAADVPACNEVITHNLNGLLHAYADPHDLANHTVHIIRDDALRQRITTYAYTHVQQTYERMITTQQAVDFYQHIIDQSTPHP